MTKYPLYLLLTGLLISCGQETASSDHDSATVTPAPRQDTLKPPPPRKSEAELWREDSIWQSQQPELQTATIQLLSVSKGWNNQTTTPKEEYPASRKWVLDSLTVLGLLQTATKTDAMHLHHAFSFLPGIMEGGVLVNGKEYYYQIDAGAYMYLGREDASQYYCYYWNDTATLKYFLAGPWNSEEEEE